MAEKEEEENIRHPITMKKVHKIHLQKEVAGDVTIQSKCKTNLKVQCYNCLKIKIGHYTWKCRSTNQVEEEENFWEKWEGPRFQLAIGIQMRRRNESPRHRTSNMCGNKNMMWNLMNRWVAT